MIFIGDIHGDFSRIKNLNNKKQYVLLGDIGLGFNSDYPTDFGSNVYFIRGNHDNPDICRRHINYLGEFGFNSKLNIFYISGAESIDKNYRTEYIDWWRDEQLSYTQFNNCLKLYEEIQPDIVVSHAAPDCIKAILIDSNILKSATETFLEQMLRIHTPKKWIFAHYHKKFNYNYHGCEFVCVDVNQRYKIR